MGALANQLKASTAATEAQTARAKQNAEISDELLKGVQTGFADQAEFEKQFAGINDREMQQISNLVQQQRALTLNRGAALKKYLPVFLAFAALGGKMAGSIGALSGFAGALAGANQGEQDRYDREQKAFSTHIDDLLKANKQTIDAANDIIKDTNTALDKRIALIKALGGGLAKVPASDISGTIRMIETLQNAHNKMVKASETFKSKTAPLPTKIRDEIAQYVYDQNGVGGTAPKFPTSTILQSEKDQFARAAAWQRKRGSIGIATEIARLQGKVATYASAHGVTADQAWAAVSAGPLGEAPRTRPTAPSSLSAEQQQRVQAANSAILAGRMTLQQAQDLARKGGWTEAMIHALSGG